MVTGASGDIGAAIARVLALGEAKVILHYRSSKERVRALASEPVFQTNGTTIVRADLTQEHDVKQMFEALAEEGSVHDIVCNAGYLKEQQVSLAEMSLQQWTTTLERNLTSTFLCLREYMRQLKNTALSDPAIVLIGSMSGVWETATFSPKRTLIE